MKNQETSHIKNGLHNLPEYEPKPELWDHIEAGLEDRKGKRIIYWRYVAGIAATLALMLAVKSMFRSEERLAQAHKEELRKAAETSNSTYYPDVKAQFRNNATQTSAAIDTNVQAEGSDDSNSNTKDYVGDLDVKADSVSFVGTVQVIPMTTQSSWNLASLDYSSGTTTSSNSEFTNSSSIGLGETYYWNFGEGDKSNAKPEPTTVNSGYSVNEAQMRMAQWTGRKNKAKGKKDQNFQQIVQVDEGSVSADVYDYYGTEMEIDEEYDIVDDYIGERNEEVLISGNISTPNKRVIEKKKYQEYAMDSIRLFDSKSWEPINTESYYPLIENDYLSPLKEPLSTFGIDVDNASYAVMRTKINSRQVVPKDAVRIEEFVNYFNYSYSQPTGSAPFSINLENANCPWNSKHQLVRIGLKGKEIDYHNLQSSNLVFLIDVSGSMSDENKLPLVKKSLKLLVDQMGNNDRIAIVTYAGAAGLALKSTRCNEKDFIKKKIDKLDAGGSTAGGQGIQLAYKVALENLINEGNNRVILCTDGDFNVGQSSDAAMKNLIIQNRNKGIFITACGFGMGNYQDSKMETIADNGNGNYFYIDTYRESTKVFERDIRATLFTIAKDVKIQVEFNPKHVKAYRLIGYENRKMPPQDFADDTKDGGELGAGHTVTALYEIIPASSSESIPGEYNLKYQRPKVTSATNFSDELLTVKLRYKQPNGSTSSLVQKSIKSGAHAFNDASQDFRFAAGTALFAQQLRQSKYIDQPDFSLAKRILVQAKGSDVNGDRQELITLINQAENVYSTYSKRD